MLAAMARTTLAPLPDLAPALRRHLRELPSVQNGLGLTEELILEMLAEGSRTIGQMFHGLMSEREPLPWLGDVMFLHIVETMRRGSEQVFEISPETAAEPWPRRALTITETGRKVLRGEQDWLALTPQDRWVGGIRIRPNAPAWRWDDDKAEAVLR